MEETTKNEGKVGLRLGLELGLWLGLGLRLGLGLLELRVYGFSTANMTVSGKLPYKLLALAILRVPHIIIIYLKWCIIC